MFSDILNCLISTSVVLLVFLSVVCGVPVDEVECTGSLKDIRTYMNESVNPCDNFYEFACGNWAAHHPLTHLFAIMRVDFEDKVRKSMTTADSADNEQEQKVKDFYQSCMKLSEEGKVYRDHMKNLAKEFGKMPAMEGDNWEEESFDWQKTVAAISYKYGINVIINYGFSTDLYDTSATIMVITNGDDIKSKLFYSNEQYNNNNIEMKAGLMGIILDIPEALALETAKDIVAFEASLAQGIPDQKLGLQEKDIYIPTTLDKLQNTYLPVLNITEHLSEGFGSIPSYTYYENRMFLENMVKVISKTPKKTVANYIYFQFLNEFMPLAENLETFCISKVKNTFPGILENIVYRKYTKNRTLNDLKAMFNNIKLAFEDILNSPNLNWIHSDTRSYAVEKLNAMEMEVPASIVDEDFARFIHLYTVDKEDYLENMKTLRILTQQRKRNSTFEPHSTTIDAQDQDTYTPANILTYNKVTIPVAVLQPHYMFSSSLPRAFNFGKLGSVLGHEVVHGFDNKGRTYDKEGRLREWWDKDSADAFNDHVTCFIDQYAQYEYGGHKLPRLLHQGENIADNSGLRVAYQAYLKWYQNSARTHEERKLETFPGFPYNNKQLFFISYAQVWCADTDPALKHHVVASDTHTPIELRAMAALSNMDEFSEEFNCPLGSAMNPIKKCKIY